MAETVSILSRLLERLGLPALSWLLAEDPDVVMGWAHGSAHPHPSVAAVAGSLDDLVGRVVTDDQPTSFRIAAMLSQYIPEADRTVAAEIRRHAGGGIQPSALSDDRATAALQLLAAELIPVFLLPPDDELRAFPNHVGLAAAWGHPLADQARSALLQSLPLESWLQSETIVMRSSGAGGPLNPALLPQQIITGAATSWIFGPQWPDPEDLSARVAEAVTHLGRLAEGRITNVQMLIGIDGLLLHEGVSASLPWGTLRPVRPHERVHLPPHAPDALLDCTVPFRVSTIPAESLGQLPQEFWQPFALSEQYVRDLVVAILLANISPASSTASAAFRLVTDPVQGIPQASWSPPAPSGQVPVEFTVDDVPRLEEWAHSYARNHHKSLDVAVRRSVSATRRTDMSDGFVDAVIGWDNAFGSARGESVLRISASFARLLGTSPDDRRKIATYVKEAYDLRSRLVHGDLVELDPADAREARDSALDLLVQALRLLYTERQDLLPHNSGQRSQAVLLQ